MLISYAWFLRNVDKVGIMLRINQRAINNENKIKGNGIQIQKNVNLYQFIDSNLKLELLFYWQNTIA